MPRADRHQGPIRWAVAATGAIADRFAREFAAVADPGAELAAVGSRTAATAEAFAARHGIGRAHGSYEALAADDGIDAVYAANLAPFHCPLTKLFLESGKHVLVEKPMALNAAEAAEMAEAAEANDRFLMEAMWMRFNPLNRRVAGLVADGAIGEVHRICADFSIAVDFNPGHRLWSLEAGGGALLDLGIYPVSLAWWLLGEPSAVDHVTHVAPTGVDDDISLLLGWETGAAAVLTASIRSDGSAAARIDGSTGSITIEPRFHSASAARLHTADGTTDLTAEASSLHWQVDEVNRCLRAGLRQSPDHPNSTPRAMLSRFDAVRADAGIRYPTEPARP